MKIRFISMTRNSLAIIFILHLVLTEKIFQFYFYLDWSIYSVYSGIIFASRHCLLIQMLYSCQFREKNCDTWEFTYLNEVDNLNIIRFSPDPQIVSTMVVETSSSSALEAGISILVFSWSYDAFMFSSKTFIWYVNWIGIWYRTTWEV